MVREEGMKKFLISAIVMLFVASFAFIFVACEANYGALSGNYYLTSVTYQNGTTKTAYQVVSGGQITDKANEYIKLNKEQGCSFSGLIKTAIGAQDGKYSVQDNAASFLVESGCVVATIEGKTIVINISGTTYVFVKA